MSAHLFITDQAYALSLVKDDRVDELARLEGGAQVLLPARQPLSERLLESAIEVAEDWLMPHAARLQGEVLEVTEASGSLQEGLEHLLSSNARQWTVEEIKQTFVRLVGWATGRGVPSKFQNHRPFLAHLILMRELAHHGRVSAVQLNQFKRAHNRTSQ